MGDQPLTAIRQPLKDSELQSVGKEPHQRFLFVLKKEANFTRMEEKEALKWQRKDINAISAKITHN